MRRTGLEFVAKAKLGVRELGEPPELGPADVLLVTEYTGVTNGTERHAFLLEHDYASMPLPSRHGYQHVGKVAAVGADVTRLAVGDRVFYGDYVGHNGWNVVKEDGLLVVLPPDVDHRYCALFGVAGVALRAVRRMGVGRDDTVWVVGQGPIGNFLAQAARSTGARVTVSDMIDERLAAAKACGIEIALNAKDPKTPARLKDGGPYDYIFDCCGAERLLFDIHEHRLLAYGGTVGMMAVRDEVRYPWCMLHGTEARIETSCHFDNDDLKALLRLYEAGTLKVAPVVSHMVSIDEAPRIYELLARTPSDLLGVIFDWGDGA